MQSIDPKLPQLPHSYGHQPAPYGHPAGAPISPIGPRPPGDSFDAMPSQRGRFFYEQAVAPSQSWLHREPAALPSFGHLAAASQLDFLYRENTRFPDKVPFLGFFFDRNMLRNEFERFVLLKLSGAAESELKEAIHPSAAGKETGKETRTEAETALYAHAKATRVAFQQKARGGREEDDEEKKAFFDGESDASADGGAGEEEVPSWRENEPNVTAETNRRTFGGAGERVGERAVDGQQARRRWQNGAEKLPGQPQRWQKEGEREQQQRWQDTGEKGRAAEPHAGRFKPRFEANDQNQSQSQVQRRGVREWRGRGRGMRGGQRGRGGFQPRGRAEVNDDDNYFQPAASWQQPAPGNEASVSAGASPPQEEAGWGKAAVKPAVSFGGEADAKRRAAATPAAADAVSFGDGGDRESAVVFG